MKIKILLLLLLFPLFLFGKIQTTYLVTEGSGSSRASAVRDALIEAVKQTQGVAISAKRAYAKSIKEAGISIDGDSSHGVSITEHSVKKIKEATRGFIRNYRIVDSYKQSGEWIVKVQIKMLKYKTPGFNPQKRRKLSVIPFEYKNSYVVLGDYTNGKVVSKRFTQALVSKITQSRKFTVLDRENSKYYVQEKNFILSQNSSKLELLKLGKRLGSDYLVVGQILDYKVDKVTEHNNIGIPETSSLVCEATVSYRILAMATQQIKWSETVSTTFSLDGSVSDKSAEAIVALSMDKIAGEILNHILSNIYPPMILAVTSGSIIVNQGGNSIHQGDIFKTYKKGERLVDPYTHEFLGYEELETGTIKITAVRPKISYAKLLNGIVNKGMVLRSVEQKSKKNKSEGEATTDVKIAPSGGVVLPFD